MARKPVEINGIKGEVLHIPPTKEKRYRCRLDSMKAITSEMSRLYREARSGALDVQDATKLTYMLSSIGKALLDSDIEARVEALEKTK
jgi:hypothetical protein